MRDERQPRRPALAFLSLRYRHCRAPITAVRYARLLRAGGLACAISFVHIADGKSLKKRCGTSRARPPSSRCRAGGLACAISFVRIADEGNGAPEEIRTPDPQIRSLVLYPAELRVRFEGANLLGRLAKGKHYPCRVGTLPQGFPRFPASISGNVQISSPSGIVVPCPLPPCWLRLGRESASSQLRRMGLGLGAKSSWNSAGLGAGQWRRQRRT